MTTEFEPRSGKAGSANPDDHLTEITYTGTKDEPWSPGDEIPAGAEVIDVTGPDDEEPVRVLRRVGVQKTLKATNGVFHPKDAEDARALDAFDLPVARETARASEAPKSDKGE